MAVVGSSGSSDTIRCNSGGRGGGNNGVLMQGFIRENYIIFEQRIAFPKKIAIFSAYFRNSRFVISNTKKEIISCRPRIFFAPEIVVRERNVSSIMVLTMR